MFENFRSRLRREAFLPTLLSLVISPTYIIRRGLLTAISHFAKGITGDVLDFGCGSKPYASLFSRASSYVGVDIAVSGHDHESSKVDIYYDGKTLPFQNTSFDAIVCFEVLEHVFNLDEVLTEIGRVLKPGGQLLVSVPFAWDEHEAPYDFARYTSFGIRHVLERNGFRVVALRKTTTYVLAVSQMFIAYLSQHALPQGKFLGRATQLAVIFPFTLLAVLLDALLPKRYEYFCNSVILASNNRGIA